MSLIRELAQALVAEVNNNFEYACEEVIVESATYITASAAGLDTSGESIPYVAGWGEDGALEAIQQVAPRQGGQAAVAAAARSDRSRAATWSPMAPGSGNRRGTSSSAW